MILIQIRWKSFLFTNLYKKNITYFKVNYTFQDSERITGCDDKYSFKSA